MPRSRPARRPPPRRGRPTLPACGRRRPPRAGRSRRGPAAATRRSASGRRAEQVPALLERVGDGDEDPLAVDQQVGQVVGDEVAERRSAAGRRRSRRGRRWWRPRRRAARRCRATRRAGAVFRRCPGAPNRSKNGCVCDSPSKMIDDTPERDEGHVRPAPARLEQAAPEGPAGDAPVLVHQPPVGEPAEGPEPDRERLAVGAPFVATELGHHRQREGGVADDHDEQRGRTGHDDELQPDEEREARDRRPAPERAPESRRWPSPGRAARAGARRPGRGAWRTGRGTARPGRRSRR